jgi:hypothetical protein
MRVGDDLFLAVYVTDVCRETGDEIEMVELLLEHFPSFVGRQILRAFDPSGW